MSALSVEERGSIHARARELLAMALEQQANDPEPDQPRGALTLNALSRMTEIARDILPSLDLGTAWKRDYLVASAAIALALEFPDVAQDVLSFTRSRGINGYGFTETGLVLGAAMSGVQ